ncbi:glycoside hydrolase family 13 protein [Gilvimarinus polysaccharolyticus]|uniref:glycoside hydrolase family 13 protein n=1 Tax=Gilvimarinus polysaccharolyticus TaxID=863921 RepID=UPI00067353FE|nr:glycoside hydrolase family 13 protein [Gilvimarinus polysaccharolyticus]
MKYWLVLTVLMPLLAFANGIDRVEPPSWWVGMDSAKLQLLVHGKNIGQLQPKLDHPGVSVVNVHKADSPNYLFIDLRIDPDAAVGEMTLEFYQGETLTTRWPYSLQARVDDSAKRQGFSAKDVIYLITPDRFANGNPSNDSVASLAEGLTRDAPGGRHGGDLAGIMNHLDYISDMGFTQLWLNPVLENAQPEYSYHGYAITDFYRVDPRFGSNDQYLALAQQARQQGVGLIMDVVLNHCGSEHWWMADAPFTDWINFSGEFSPTTHRRTTLRDPHAAASDTRQFTDGWFVPTMPDLNQRNEFMAEYLIQNSLWWIEYAGLSGVRVDTYSYPDKNFLVAWGERVMAEYPNFNIVGEEWSNNPAIVSYWQTGKHNPDGYQPQLPSLMDFSLQTALINALTHEESWGEGMIELYEALSNDFLYPNPDNLVVFADNHDMSRIYTQLNENYDLWQQAMVYLLTTRGIPQIYYGTEILMTNPGTEDHGVIRTDFPGGWPDDKINAFTAKGLSKDSKRAQDLLRKLLNWRKNNAAITEGRLVHYAPQNGVYVYFNIAEKSEVMTIINHSDKARELKLDRFSDLLAGSNKGVDVMSDKLVKLTESLRLAPMSSQIIELQ